MAKPDLKAGIRMKERNMLAAIFLEEIDGMLTSEIAERFGLSTKRVYRLLKPLSDKGIKGVTGRDFMMNGEGNDRGIKHSVWFFQ